MIEELEYGAEASPARIAEALGAGGRAVVTVRSAVTGRHVTVVLACRVKGADGRWVSRATVAGRVGAADADVIEARDPDVGYPDDYVGRYYLPDGGWRPGRQADPTRAWTAARVIDFALMGRSVGDAEVFIAASCSFCGKHLTDPESIERGIGPECFGRHTSSRAAERVAVAS